MYILNIFEYLNRAYTGVLTSWRGRFLPIESSRESFYNNNKKRIINHLLCESKSNVLFIFCNVSFFKKKEIFTRDERSCVKRSDERRS